MLQLLGQALEEVENALRLLLPAEEQLACSEEVDSSKALFHPYFIILGGLAFVGGSGSAHVLGGELPFGFGFVLVLFVLVVEKDSDPLAVHFHNDGGYWCSGANWMALSSNAATDTGPAPSTRDSST